jgi:signal transduction histidine kinase/CheY-like chemotaxis protein
MAKKGASPAKPHVVLLVCITCTALAALYLPGHSPELIRTFLLLGGAFLSLLLYSAARSKARAEHVEEQLQSQLEQHRLMQAEREREQLLRLEHTARKQAESANRVKDEFIATLSHELRTPLTPILGWTQLLRHRTFEPSFVARGLDVIEHNARSQAKLIEDLLDVSRIVTGKMRVKTQTVEIQSLIESAVDAMRPAADAKGILMETAVNATAVHLPADPNRLQQVFWNLLSNAIKFTPPGGTVMIAAERTGTDLRVVVRDTGIGIDAEFLPHVFERFSQADSTNVRAHSGLGIGLAIVRYFVELHGGSVTVQSAGKGSGTTFTVVLPIKTMPARIRPRKQKPVARTFSSLKGLRLLIVDDEPQVLELLSLVLEHEGATIVTAASAEQALQAYEINPPDILISDIAMPEENGYVLLQKIREMEQRRNRRPAPAIALTAYARDEDKQRSLEAGFDIHLSKPISSEELISALLGVARKSLGKAG